MNGILLSLAYAVLMLTASMEPLRAQGSKSCRIGVVVDGPWERNESLMDALQKEIRDVLGKDVQVIFPPQAMLVGDWTLAKARTLNEQLLRDPQVDLILGMGLITSQDLATRGPLPKPVMAAIIVDAERQHVPSSNGTSGTRNLSYLVYPTTFVRDLQLFREIITIRKLVNISSAPYEAVLPAQTVGMQELGKGLGLDVVDMRIGFSADEILNALPGDADAVFLGPTLHLPPAEFHKLVRGFVDRRLPSFSFFGDEEVRQGIMASANPDLLPRLFRRIALNVRHILDGEEPGSLPTLFTPGKHLTINIGTAYAVGVSPKWSTLLEADLVHMDSAAAGATSVTFPEAVRRFAEQNLDVQAKVREVAAEANNGAIAKSVLMPKIDIGATGVQIDKDHAQAGGQPQRSASWDVSASQLVFAEPALANLSIQSSLQEARTHDLEIVRLNTIVDGSTLYFNYLRARKLFSILLDNLKLVRTNLELARVRQSTGVAGQEETLRWEVEIANLRKSAMDDQAQMNQALLGLKQILNIPLIYLLNVVEVSPDDPELLISSKDILGSLEDPLSFDLLSDFLTGEASRLSPELRQLDAAIAGQERSLTSTKLSHVLPTISAFGKFSKQFYASDIVSPFQLPAFSSAPPPATPAEAFLYQMLGSFSLKAPGSQNWNVGVQLSLNLFNGFGTSAAQDRASMLLEEARVQRSAVAEKVALRIRIELEKAKASYFAITQARLEQDAARRTLEIVTQSYSRGAVSILSLLDAQNTMLRADQVSANAGYDFLINYVSLERAIGSIDVLMTSSDRSDFLGRLHIHMTQLQKR